MVLPDLEDKVPVDSTKRNWLTDYGRAGGSLLSSRIVGPPAAQVRSLLGGPCKGVHVNAPIGPAGSLVEPGEAAFGKDEPSKPKCPKRPGEWL